MKKAILAALSLAGAASAYGQGAFQIDNLFGTPASIVPIFGVDGTTKLAGANYSVEVFRFDAAAANGIGTLLGAATDGIGANFRFRNKAGTTIVDGAAPGTTINLIVRAWDATGGVSYADATTKGKSASWTSKPLGGIDANNTPIPPPKLDGFASFKLDGTATVGPVAPGPVTVPGANAVPEPTTIALGALGAAALVLRRRK